MRSPRSRSRILVMVSLALAMIGCSGGDSNAPKTPTTVTGTWVGTSSGATVNLVLTENSGTVSGSGTMVAGTASIALTVAGSHNGASVSLTFKTSGFQDTNLTGTFAGNSITGTLNGSGFVNEPVTLQRQ